MAEDKGMDCIDCHGTMITVSQNPSPWLNEPRCDSAACHGSGYAQDQPLYRLYNPNNGLHHWTMDSNEKTVLVSYGFIDEGIACYVFPQ